MYVVIITARPAGSKKKHVCGIRSSQSSMKIPGSGSNRTGATFPFIKSHRDTSRRTARRHKLPSPPGPPGRRARRTPFASCVYFHTGTQLDCQGSHAPPCAQDYAHTPRRRLDGILGGKGRPSCQAALLPPPAAHEQQWQQQRRRRQRKRGSCMRCLCVLPVCGCVRIVCGPRGNQFNIHIHSF